MEALYFLLLIVPALLYAYAIVKGPGRLLWWAGFTIPLNGLSFFLGVGWTWPKLVPLCLLPPLLFIRLSKGAWALPGRFLVVGFLVLAGLTTAYFGIFDGRGETLRGLAASIGWASAQTDYRAIVQYSVLLSTWSFPFLIYALARTNAGRGLPFLTGFIHGNTWSVIVGVYLALAATIGLPTLSAGDLSEVASGNLGIRDSLQSFDLTGSTSVVRFFGLGGEPKHTGASLCVALALLVLLPRIGVGKLRRVLEVAFFLGLLWTFSTSAWLAFGAVAVFTTLASVRTILARQGHALAAVASLIAAFGLVFAFTDEDSRTEILQARIFSRLESSDSVRNAEWKDATLLAYVAAEPSTVLIGKGVGTLDFFLLPHAPPQVDLSRSTPTPTYFVPRTIGETGVFGLGIVLSVLAVWYQRLSTKHDGRSNFLLAASILLLSTPMTVVPSILGVLSALLGQSDDLNVLTEGTRGGSPAARAT